MLHAKRLRMLMEIEWYAAQRGISGQWWRRVVYDYAKRGFPIDSDPHPLFSTSWYLEHNPAIVDEGVNPLVHYLLTGEGEGRSPHLLFDPEYYRRNAGSDKPVGLSHFLSAGDRFGFSPHPSFEPKFYRAQLQDDADPTFTSFLLDPAPRYAPNPWFSPGWFLHRHPRVGEEGANPLLNYERAGRPAGLSPAPDWMLLEQPIVVQSAQQPMAASLQTVAASSSDASVDSLTAFGVRMTPLVGGYALFALEQAVRAGAETMHFFTREGEFIVEAVEELIEADVFGLKSAGHDYPQTDVLEVSRLATFAASLDRIDQKSLMRMWSTYPTQSPAALGKTLKIPSETVEASCRRVGLLPDEEVTKPWKSPLIAKLLEDTEFALAANQRRVFDRKALLRYLESHDIAREGTEPLLIVDLGWRGSIQDNLAYLLPKRTIHGVYLGLVEFVNEQPWNVSKAAWLYDKNKGEETERRVWGAATETLFNAPGGTVVGYTAGGESTAVREVYDSEEEALEDAYRPVQQASLAALPEFSRRVGLDGLTAQSLRALGLTRLDEYVEQPPAELARAFEKLEHNETFGLGKRSSRAHESANLDVISGSAPFFSRIVADVRTAAWQASRARVINDFTETHVEDCYRDWVPRQVRSLEEGAADLTGASVAVYMHSLLDGSGLHRSTARVLTKLVDYGLETTLVLDKVDDAGERFLTNYVSRVPVRVDYATTTDGDFDVAIATTAQSARVIAESGESARGLYVAQGFEADYNGADTKYLADQDNYVPGIPQIVIGNWLTHRIRNDHGGHVAGAGPGVNHRVYHPTGTTRENAICFLYRPAMGGGPAHLAIEAIQRFQELRPDVEILAYGSEAEMPPGMEVTRMGRMTNLDDLNALYNRCKGGICLSGNLPSRTNFEMMAAGVVPVDLYRYSNLFDYADATAILAYPSPESLARALASLFDDEEDRNRRSQASISHASSLTFEWETAVLANGVASMLSTGSLREPPVSRSYHEAAYVAASDRGSEIEAFLTSQLRQADQ